MQNLVRRPLAWIIGGFVLLATLYSVVIPPFETPDEIWHFAFVQHLVSGKGLPVSAPNTQALWRQQGVQSPGYYLAAAALTAWIDQSDFPDIYARANPHAAIGRPDSPDNINFLVHHASEGWPWRNTVLALHIARFFSIFLGAVTLWAIQRALRPLLGDQRATLGAALFAFLPQFIFISAAASNDNAINATATLTLWLLVLLVTDPAERRGRWTGRRGLLRFVAIGVLLGLALLSKLSGLALAGLAGLALLLAAWRGRSWRTLVLGGVAIFVPALLVAGWWFVRNWTLYADPLAWNIWQANILLRVTPAGWETIVAELVSLERSFWGLFGWLNVPYPSWVYLVFRAIEVIIAAGLVLAAGRWLVRSRRIDWRWAGGGLLMLWLAALAVSWVRFMRIAPAAQGRYFFPAAPALALLAVVAFGAWIPGLIRRGGRPQHASPLGWGVVGLLAVLSILTPVWIIAPAYRPPASAAELAPRLTPVEADLAGQFAVLGVAGEPAIAAPGQPLTVTVSWQALAPVDADYSVFVHLVNDDGLVVAQKDTMPGGGQRPTSQWLPGETRVEQYRVVVPATAYTPDHGWWAVGLYDHRTEERLPVTLHSPAAGVAANDDQILFGDVTLAAASGDIPNPLSIDFLDNVTLLGYSLSARSVSPGDPLTVTLYWQARGPVSGDYTTFAHLLDASGETRGGHDATPQPATRDWQPGQVITDIHSFTVAEDAPPGAYQIEASLYTRPAFDRLTLVRSEGAEGADRVLLGQLRVNER
ncbi:MAG: glycosyltransferase family 39 protein [Anaerolineae bacterium]|nr:glycosyltransferase family 39 protein [Anaerolineae bacterium]